MFSLFFALRLPRAKKEKKLFWVCWLSEMVEKAGFQTTPYVFLFTHTDHTVYHPISLSTFHCLSTHVTLSFYLCVCAFPSDLLQHAKAKVNQMRKGKCINIRCKKICWDYYKILEFGFGIIGFGWWLNQLLQGKCCYYNRLILNFNRELRRM